jgi:hypothetical protein
MATKLDHETKGIQRKYRYQEDAYRMKSEEWQPGSGGVMGRPAIQGVIPLVELEGRKENQIV